MTYPYCLGKATGGARMSREIARHLGRAGADVTLLPVSMTPESCFPRPRPADDQLGLEFDAELAADSVTVCRVPQHPLHWILDGLAVKKVLQREIAKARPDLVLSYYHEAGFLPAMLAAQGIRFGYISTWQLYQRALAAPLRKVPRSIWPWVRRKLILEPHRRAAILFATSEFTRRELVEHVGVDADRVVICRLGVAPHFFDIPVHAAPQVTKLLFFGRVIASKGVLDAMQALARLAEQGVRDWTLRIVGQGDREWAANAAAEFGIAEQVELNGAVDDAGLRRELTAADLAILPSHFEAFGLCFAEAQAAGLPVVAYDAGSVPEIVQHESTGWLAPTGDVDALAECIATAIRDPEATRAAGLAGRERARQCFT